MSMDRCVYLVVYHLHNQFTPDEALAAEQRRSVEELQEECRGVMWGWRGYNFFHVLLISGTLEGYFVKLLPCMWIFI